MMVFCQSLRQGMILRHDDEGTISEIAICEGINDAYDIGACDMLPSLDSADCEFIC